MNPRKLLAFSGVLLGCVSFAQASDAPPSIFAGGLGNLILTLVIFGTVVFILGTKAWPVLLKALDERERRIRESLEAAKREREESERLLKEYEQQLQQARTEATAIVDEGRRDAEVVRKRVQDEARAEADKMLERARSEITLAKDGAIKELYDQTAELSIDVAGRIIRKEMNADDHRHLVTESLERMRASQN